MKPKYVHPLVGGCCAVIDIVVTETWEKFIINQVSAKTGLKPPDFSCDPKSQTKQQRRNKIF